MTRILNRRLSRRTMLAGSAGGVLSVSLAAIPAACRGKVYPGTTIHGIDLSGNSADESFVQLTHAFSAFEQHAVTFTFEDRSWEVSLADLGVAIDYDTMVEQALAHGRDSSVVNRYRLLLGDQNGREIPLAFQRDQHSLHDRLAQIGDEIAVAPVNAALELQDGVVAVIDEIPGRRLDLPAAIRDANLVIESGATGKVELKTLPVVPEVLAADLHPARDEAFLLVSEPVRFTHDDLVYPVDASTLAAALSIDAGNSARLDPTLLEDRLETIAKALYVPARNVKLGWDAGLYVVAEDVDGLQVDREALAAAVLTLAQSTERTAPLPVTPVKAAARADNFKELGIDAYLTTGSSSFAGSSYSRAENVAVSARNISYQLVAPGETFSFNQLLGPITHENGFVDGSIIEGDFAATDIGGGVCQVSTTVFRAAARAGFQFSEWHPHTWRLAFYEADGSPPGFDGAIYQPNSEWEMEMDLRFTNPLDSWLLLQVLITGDTVAAHFYGRPNGWNVEFGEPRLSAPKAIPEPVERVNEDRGPGERVQVQYAQPGVTVSLRRTVTAADGTVISDGDFVSDYVSIPDVWEIGPS